MLCWYNVDIIYKHDRVNVNSNRPHYPTGDTHMHSWYYESDENNKESTMAELQSGSIPLSEHDHDWFKVMTNMAERSIRANLGNVLSDFVASQKPAYVEKIQYEANKYGLEFDEVFQIYRTATSSKEAQAMREELIKQKI